MRLNNNLFYVHRCITGFYIVILILLIIVFFIFDFKRENLLFAILIIALYCGLGTLHFKASNEAAKGTSVGKNLSQGIGILLLIGFPVGTILGCIILYFTSKKRWQSDGNEVE